MDDRLGEALRLVLMGQIAGGVSHDLNNVLGKIIGLAEMTQDQLTDRPEAHAELETLITVAEQGARLVGRLEACCGRDIAEPQTFDLATLVRAAREVAESRRPGLHAPLNAPADRFPVAADPALMRIALDAVLDNASRWGARRVEVSCRAVSESGDEEAAEVTVRDDGGGMAAEVLGRAFDPFFTTRPAGEAPGVGLSLARLAMDACGGHIEADSSPGEGTTVRLILPREARR
jgi:signal transduction histidine kinase